MKTTAQIIFALTLGLQTAVVAQEPMDLDALVLRGDVYVHPETFEPYSGEVVAMWNPVTVKERGRLVNGRWDGLHEWYHLNGQLATRETYVDGRLNGLSESYFKNGTLSLLETYVDDQLDGPYEAYWTRGWLAERGGWSAGRPCGDWESFGDTVIYPPCPW